MGISKDPILVLGRCPYENDVYQLWAKYSDNPDDCSSLAMGEALLSETVAKYLELAQRKPAEYAFIKEDGTQRQVISAADVWPKSGWLMGVGKEDIDRFTSEVLHALGK